MEVARPVTRLPFSSISIVQIIISHQYVMVSIILVIVWLIFWSPLLMKINVKKNCSLSTTYNGEMTGRKHQK